MVSDKSSTIARWEKKYSTDIVRILVTEAMNTTRSKLRKRTFQKWLDEHPKPQRLIPFEHHRRLEESLLYQQLPLFEATDDDGNKWEGPMVYFGTAD